MEGAGAGAEWGVAVGRDFRRSHSEGEAILWEGDLGEAWEVKGRGGDSPTGLEGMDSSSINNSSNSNIMKASMKIRW